MADLSRRSVLEGLGAGVLMALCPATLQAEAPLPLRSVEECFGPRRIARIAELCRGAPVRGSMARVITNARDIYNPRLYQMLDDDGRFRMLPEYRRAITLAMNGYEPVRFEVGAESWRKVLAGESIDDTVYFLAWRMRVPVPNLISHDYTPDGRGLITYKNQPTPYGEEE
ncbi:hypothetical protein [Rhodoplanes sp. SY1]|uniref:hypothetical protein n=1 Tax=Rhodoplanes sp. SY1 TaxID=3166646 RepID=UPI0038B437F5